MLSVELAKYIATRHADLTYDEAAGGNVFVDHLPEGPDQCVAVYVNGGTEASSSLEYDAPGIQIIVRGTKSPVWALGMWYDLYGILHAKRNMALPDGTYLAWALVVQSGPARVGPDESGRHRYSMNIRTEIINQTEERP